MNPAPPWSAVPSPGAFDVPGLVIYPSAGRCQGFRWQSAVADPETRLRPCVSGHSFGVDHGDTVRR